MACPRDRSCYKTDTSKNEDGHVTRNVCVNSVVCLLEFCSAQFLARRIRRHAKNLQVGSEFRFNFLVDITNTFFVRSRGPFRGGVVPAFVPRTTAS